MPNYQSSKIYKVCNTEDDQEYYGSTTFHYLSNRMCCHRSAFQTGKHQTMRLYNHMKTIGVEKFFIVLIETYPCNSKEQLFARERYWIEKDTPSLNKARPVITHDESMEYRKDYTKKWRKENPEKYHQQQVRNSEKNREKNKARSREKVSCSICETVLSRGSMYHHMKHQHGKETVEKI